MDPPDALRRDGLPSAPNPAIMRTLLLSIALTGALSSTTASVPRSPSAPQATNAFTGSFRMETHLFRNGKEDRNSPMNLLYWSRPDMTLYQVMVPGQKETMRMLTDLRSDWTYTIVDDGQGNRTAMKMRMPDLAAMADDEAERGDKPTVTVTKETRTIEGHTCTKVIATSKEGTWTGWIAMGLKGPFADMARSLDQRAGQQSLKGHPHLEGFPLEFEWVPVKDQERVVCYVKDLVAGKVDDSLFDLSGYQVIELPSFAMPQR